MTAITATAQTRAKLSAQPGDLIDGVCDAPAAIHAMASSMPCRGRLDMAARSVVVTARMGQAIALQRISFHAYRGVSAVLEAGTAADDAPTVRLVLRHDRADYSITVEKGLAIEEAVAVWRGWADKLSMPMLLQSETGEESTVRAMLGGVVVRECQPRKGSVLAGRRPRFAKRRGLR